ncbi:TonB-dependent siderophore receptor [Xylophilus sp. GW821-FHT01B05]
MNRPVFRPAPLALAIALAIGCPALHAQSANALLGAPVPLNIAAQPLGQALNDWARQTRIELIVPPALVAGKAAPAVVGSLTPRQALDRLLAGSGLVAAADGPAMVVRAAPAGAESALPAVVVTASAERETGTSPVNGYVARRSTAGTKTDSSILEIPQSLSVIGRTEMEARGALDLMDVVSQTPGVSVAPYGPDNRGWEYISLRGFPGNTSSYRDGLPQTQFGVIYRMTEPYGLERVEILRGPSSVLYGQGDAGGVINRVSKAPGPEATREVEVQYGNFNRKQLAVDVGGAVGEGSDLSFRLVGVALDSQDQDRYSNGDRIKRTRAYLAPSLRWQPNAGTSLTLFGEFLNDESGEDPYYAIFTGPDGLVRHVKYGDPSFSSFKQNQYSMGYRFEHALNDTWTLRQNARYTDITMKRNALWADSLQADGHTLSRMTRSWDDALTQGSIDTQLQGTLRTAAAEHKLLFGVDWNRLDGTALRFRGTGPDLDLLNPVYGMAVATPTTPLANFTQTMDQIGLYAQDQIRFGERWIATLGGRQDHVRSTIDNRLSTRTTQTDNAFSGRVGLNYLLGNGWAPYVSYATSFLPTSGVDADNNPFKPSRGKQAEIGIKYQPEDGKSLFTAALFDLTKTNVVTYDNITSDARQIGKQRSRGLELEAKTRLTNRLNATASLTLMDLKVLQSADATEVNKIPATVPRQMASVWLDYAVGGGFGMGAGASYVGPRQNDEANTSVEGGFTLLNAVLRYDQGPWRFALNATNLLNKKYNTICYHGECYLGRERTLIATAKYRF